tara:strand:+ start:631 stop:924 length:294 start_codon:yes stop_codon:yes gene_type:complete
MEEEKLKIGICSHTRSPTTPNFCNNLCKVRHEKNDIPCVLWNIKEYDYTLFDKDTLKKISLFCNKTYLHLMLSGELPNVEDLNKINKDVVKCLSKKK